MVVDEVIIDAGVCPPSIRSCLSPSSLMQLLTPVTPLHAGWRNVSTSTSWREEVMTVAAPQFAESVSEGDVRWEKGMLIAN